MARRLKLEDAEFVRGDPAQLVLGPPDEKPATRHGEAPPPPHRALKDFEIAALVRDQMEALRPAVEEYQRLEIILKAIEKIK